MRLAVARSSAGCKLVLGVRADSLKLDVKLRATDELDCDGAATIKWAVKGTIAIERTQPSSIGMPRCMWPSPSTTAHAKIEG